MPDRRRGRRGRLTGPVLAAALAALPAAAVAESGGLFGTGGFEDVEPGERVVFRHERSGDARLPAITGGEAVILLAEAEADGARELRVSLISGGRTLPVPPMPAEAANPILLIFLENTVRHMAELTGGSPFYIRNRMREALWLAGGPGEAVTIETEGGTVDGQRVAIRPFAEDPNRAAMGAFAELRISFVLSDAVPGGIARLDARAGGGASGAAALLESFSYSGIDREER
ncbi:hypothetical protein BH23PSE1_BH23PSE1_12030 [soil metagenome]